MRYYPPNTLVLRSSPDDAALQKFSLNRRHVLDDADGVRALRKQHVAKVADLCRLMREGIREARLYAQDMRDDDNRTKAARQLGELRKLTASVCPRGK